MSFVVGVLFVMCLLFVVRWSLRVALVCNLSSVVCDAFAVVCWLSFNVGCVLRVVCCFFVVRGLLLVVRCLNIVCCFLFDVCCVSSVVVGCLLAVVCSLWFVVCSL